jgi:hypothetical protein
MAGLPPHITRPADIRPARTAKRRLIRLLALPAPWPDLIAFRLLKELRSPTDDCK